MTSPLLSIKNLIVDFGETRAVDEISLDLMPGETIAIVGESGSGKTVTALSALRLLPHKGKIISGEIWYSERNGKTTDLLSLSLAEMRKYRGNDLAMIFQDPATSLNPVFTCGDQVAEAMIYNLGFSSKQANARTLELFNEVKFSDPEQIFNAYPHEISGGQKQRVMIAMAMACGPRAIFADEPTTALDVTVQKTILDLLKELQQKHDMGIVFISHDLGVVAELADRVIVMYKGKIVEQGPVLDIFSRPKHPYTRGLLASRPPLNARLHRLPTVADFLPLEKGLSNFDPLHISNYITPEERKASLQKLYEQKPLFRVEHLSAWFTKRSGLFSGKKEIIKAVDDVSFEVYPGETLGLVGESGCGKTTLVRSILRLNEAQAGNVFYKDINLTDLSENQLQPIRKDLQLIFQDPFSALNPRLSAGEAIMEPMKVHGILSDNSQRKSKVIELLERVNLRKEHFYRFPHEFSGGERQRICIARALSLSPRFIICDESVSSLDVSVQAQVLNLLNELKKDFGFTYIFISHDLSVVRFMSDRMMVMYQGKIIESGDPDEICKNPSSPYTRKLIEAIPSASAENIEAAVKRRKQLLPV